ncbi:DUF6286 domain-containing protein [Streptomyces sp.]|uniref:DUF6286 domain-containing protein n=1 Tax=Streptomyces sp. TaxID=1931 RepID=UPI0039C99CC8
MEPPAGAEGPEPRPGPPPEGEPAEVSVDKRPEPAAVEPYALTSDDLAPVRARRFWSSRRVPAALTAAAVFALTGLFLYDIASVRADRRAMRWRTELAEELATRHLDDVWMLTGAAVAAALGLWLIVLAVTPGERRLLPMTRRGAAGVRAALDRRAAELVLRDRAMEVPGIRSARIAVRRRRIKARATSHFRELDEVRRDVTAVLGDTVRQLGLAKPPSLSVRVRQADEKG